MHKNILVAGLAAAAFIPSFAFAQQSCDQQHGARIVGTVAGAGVGALAGGAIAGRNDRTAGALIGGVAGALLGNQITRGSQDCAHAYGYYDSQGQWHATNVDRSQAQGYYDRDGAWVEGTPNGYYDAQNRWVPAGAGASESGYYESNGHWVPASANGFYDADGQWIAGAASGHYDARGRWIAGPTTGRYDQYGRWLSGQASGHRDANGQWVSDPQPGYYDASGRWIAGQVDGYYDTRGSWIPTAATSAAYDVSIPAYADRSGGAVDVDTRIARLERRIRLGAQEGSISTWQSGRALKQLEAIRQDEVRIGDRIDNLASGMRIARQDYDRNN